MEQHNSYKYSKGLSGRIAKLANYLPSYLQTLVPMGNIPWAMRPHKQTHQNGAPVENPCPLVGSKHGVSQWP